MKSKLALVVAIALALLTAVGIKSYLAQETALHKESRKTVKVLYATRKIPRGTALSPDMVNVKEVLVEAVQDGRNVFPEQLSGKLGQPVQRDVAQNALLYHEFFISNTSAENPASGMAPGFRQITIPVDKVTGLAGRLLPDSTVDILCTMRVRAGGNSSTQESVTQTVLTGVQVVATDLNVRKPAEFFSERQRRDYGSYSTVTLKVTPIQAEILAFLVDQGKLHLVIRAADDPTGRDPSRLDKITMENLDVMIKKACEDKTQP